MEKLALLISGTVPTTACLFVMLFILCCIEFNKESKRFVGFLVSEQSACMLTKRNGQMIHATLCNADSKFFPSTSHLPLEQPSWENVY